MGTARTLDLPVRPARAWVRAVRVVAVLTVLIAVAGVFSQVAALGPALSWTDLSATAVGLPLLLNVGAATAGIALALGLWRRPPGASGRLSLHAAGWRWLPEVAARPDDGAMKPQDAVAAPVEVRVAADLGDWILLKLRDTSSSAPSTWLPLARRDLPDAWHGLRCALAAPAVAHSAPSDGPDRSDRTPG